MYLFFSCDISSISQMRHLNVSKKRGVFVLTNKMSQLWSTHIIHEFDRQPLILEFCQEYTQSKQVFSIPPLSPTFFFVHFVFFINSSSLLLQTFFDNRRNYMRLIGVTTKKSTTGPANAVTHRESML